MPRAPNGIGVCAYNPAICRCTRVNGLHACVVRSILRGCLHFSNCSMGHMVGVASMNRLSDSTSANRSGVLSNTGHRRGAIVRVTGFCASTFFTSYRGLGVGHPSIMRPTAGYVSSFVGVVSILLRGNCTCVTNNGICFSASGLSGCCIFNGVGRSSLTINIHSDIRRSRGGHGGTSFIL